ncbi:MAG: hypothetical protein J0L92_13805 [Deltaproteobacteria bacterium]|nr:hypothetical protein [Deltaproteobacteria bacterium]
MERRVCLLALMLAAGCGDAEVGLDAAGLDASGLDAAGPDAAGPDAAGPDAAGPDASDERVLDAHVAPDASEPIDPDAIYVSPDGDDANDGSREAPFFTVERAWQDVSAGQTIYLRGGLYEYPDDQLLFGRSGTVESPIRVWAYPGEQPVFTDAPGYVGQDLFYFEGEHVHFRGLEIREFRPVDFGWPAFRSDASRHCIYERFDYHHNGAGMAIRRGSDDNLILRSDFHHNADPRDDYDGTDGLDVAELAAGTTNTVRECRAWWNGDDGFDAFASNGLVVFERSWAFYNGYIPDTFDTAGNGAGFKLGLAAPSGELLRIVVGNVSYRNRLWGFVENDARAVMHVFHNTSILNGGRNYWFGSWDQPGTEDDFVMIARNNVALGPAGAAPDLDGMAVTFAPFALVDHNTWNVGFVVDEADFESLDGMELAGPRGPSGELPDLRFAHLVAGSDLVDTGLDVGEPFRGSAPDLGAFER